MEAVANLSALLATVPVPVSVTSVTVVLGSDSLVDDDSLGGSVVFGYALETGRADGLRGGRSAFGSRDGHVDGGLLGSLNRCRGLSLIVVVDRRRGRGGSYDSRLGRCLAGLLDLGDGCWCTALGLDDGGSAALDLNLRRRGVSALDFGGEDKTDIDGLFLGSQVLALVRRTLEVSGVALSLDTIALLLPDLASRTASGACSVVASGQLIPALLARSPASGLIGVVRDFFSAPVAVLANAAFGSLAFRLGGLRIAACSDTGSGSQFGDRRSMHLVFGVVTVVDVEVHVVIAGIDITGNGDSRLGNQISTALQKDLRTAGIELRVSVVSGMKGEDLRASEIVTGRKTLGEGNGEKTIVVEKLVSTPLVVGCIVAVVEDLEPAITMTRVIDGRFDLLEVDGTGALVATVHTLLAGVVGP